MIDRSRSEYSIMNILTGFGGYFLNTLLGYICRIVFVQCLNADYLGINGLLTNILSMLSLAELGIGGAIGYALYKPIAEKDNEKIASLMGFYGKAYRIIGCVVALLGLFMIPFLKVIIISPPNISESIYTIYLLYLFNTASTYFFSYRSALISAAQKNYIVLGLNYIITIIQSVIQIPLLILTHNYMIYLVVQTVGTFINNFLISFIAKKMYPFITQKNAPALTKEERKKLFVNVKALTINKLSSTLVNNTDNIIITYLKGLISVGVVSNYTLLVNTLGALATQIFNGLTASVGNLNAIENKEKKYSFFKVLNLTNFWIYGWGTIGILFVCGDIVKLCFGNSYVLEFNIPLILAINFYMLGMQNAVWAYKNTMGLFKYGQYLLILTAVINLGLDFLLGYKWGMFGIYLASAISRLLTNTWYEPYAVFKYGLKINSIYYVKKYMEYIGILCITGGICYILCRMCHFTVLINVIIKILICSIVTNGMFYSCYHKTEEGKYLLNKAQKIMGRFKKRK